MTRFDQDSKSISLSLTKVRKLTWFIAMIYHFGESQAENLQKVFIIICIYRRSLERLQEHFHVS